MTSVMEEIVKHTRDAIILVASNPVDILTQVAVEAVNYDPKKIIGSGTVLDSSRFRYLLSEHCGIDARNIHGYILGEHGDSEVATWSLTNIAGTRIDEYYGGSCNDYANIDKDAIFIKVRDAGYDIIERKPATYYGVAMAIRRIVEAILRNENSILTVSSVQTGAYGISDIALSVPTLVNASGISKVLELPLDENEHRQLLKSADTLKEILFYALNN